jgi:hypothetical protein
MPVAHIFENIAKQSVFDGGLGAWEAVLRYSPISTRACPRWKILAHRACVGQCAPRICNRLRHVTALAKRAALFLAVPSAISALADLGQCQTFIGQAVEIGGVCSRPSRGLKNSDQGPIPLGRTCVLHSIKAVSNEKGCHPHLGTFGETA